MKRLWMVVALGALVACAGGDDGDAGPLADAIPTEGSGADVATADDGSESTGDISLGGADDGADEIAEPEPEPEVSAPTEPTDGCGYLCTPGEAGCEVLVPFHAGPYGTNPRDVAGPFTLPTLRGELDLEAVWTGAESFVFVLYQAGHDYLEPLWQSDLFSLINDSPKTVHYIFMAYPEQGGIDSAAASMEGLQERLDEALELYGIAWGEEAACHWRRHLHLVPTAASQNGTWIDQMLAERPVFAFAIDRFQRLRNVGLLNLVQQPPVLTHLRFAAEHYDFELEREGWLEEQSFDEVVLLDGDASGATTFDVELPSAEALAGYDSMYVELASMCEGHDVTKCFEWDTGVHLDVLGVPVQEPNPHAEEACEAGAVLPCMCVEPGAEAPVEREMTCNAEGTGYGACACRSIEIGRWITTYNREGRWIHDITPFLAALRAGGTHRFHFSPGYAYITTLKLHLRDDPDVDVRPTSIERLWHGGGYGEGYNDGYEPMPIAVAESAARVEVVAHITGHGFGKDVANCAEFCNHTHHFRLNGGTEHVKEHPWVGQTYGCAFQISEGTVPNQYGTWTLGRGGWCPGKQVDTFRADVTADAAPGASNVVSYESLLEGEPYVPIPYDAETGGFGANIWMESWLVTYE